MHSFCFGKTNKATYVGVLVAKLLKLRTLNVSDHSASGTEPLVGWQLSVRTFHCCQLQKHTPRTCDIIMTSLLRRKDALMIS